MKAQKKQAKKEQQEREDLVKEKLKEVQRLQAVLNTFGDEKVRQDFLDGKSGDVCMILPFVMVGSGFFECCLFFFFF